MIKNFDEYYIDKFKNYDDFLKETKGIVYLQEEDNQLKLIELKPNDLANYWDYQVIETYTCNLILHIIIKKERI